jgi:hypothetical protein
MTYPLNMQLPAPQVGFAVANDEAEHAALSEAGYEPKFVEGQTIESVRAALDEAGIAYDKRLSLAKLIKLLPE